MRILINSSGRLYLPGEETFLFKGCQFPKGFKTFNRPIKDLYLHYWRPKKYCDFLGTLTGEVLIKCPS